LIHHFVPFSFFFFSLFGHGLDLSFVYPPKHLFCKAHQALEA